MTSPSTLEIAVVQFDALPGDVPGNVDRLVETVRVHGPEVGLLVAPELATTGYDLGLLEARGAQLAETRNGPSLQRLAAACQDTAATLMVGFLEAGDGGDLYDSVATITPEGKIEVYRKTHLFPAELPYFTAGDQLHTIATSAAVLGPMICFEHAFPEVATALAMQGAQILVIPSAVPIGFEYLLLLRTRARAQDNQVFAVACNMAGHGFCGRSLVADPRGDVLAAAGDDATVLRARLDLSAVEHERAQEPALSMRRPDLYRAVPGQE